VSEAVQKIIPIARAGSLSLGAIWDGSKARDTFSRPLHDLRISVTDRCNFRCSYCMPKSVFDKHHQFLPQAELLSFEEITRTARLFTQLGVKKLRITGGEPLLRKNLEVLIAQLAKLQTPDGKPLDITLTTNASVLAKKAQVLKNAGLQRITVSLDALNDDVFRAMNDVDFPVRDVLEGIEAACRVGLSNIKVNMVVKRGTNDQEIVPMARHFRGTPVTLRFIEYMDVGSTNGWVMDEVVPSEEVVQRIASEFAVVPLGRSTSGETAERYGYANTDGEQDANPGEFGTISSVTRAFCRDCNRARLSTDGKLYTCLFGHTGHDVRSLLRSAASDEQILGVLYATWAQRSDRYSEIRASQGPDIGGEKKQVEKRVEMSYIGG
jgi:cyclic pyranopterin phosphate synthase